MAPKRLDWDSDFFALEVFGVELRRPADVPALVESLRQMDARLCYIFLKERDAVAGEMLVSSGAILYDEKITYGKTLLSDAARVCPAVESYSGALTEELLHLAFLAGHESRFWKDPRLRDRFEALYERWMINSLNGTMADKTFIYRCDGAIKGMVTCKCRADQTGNIGLIATDAGAQGKGIGKCLVDATENYYRSRQLSISTVVTQRSNIQACRFYERSGFTEYQTEYVYHLWLN
jgi:ribosomal protein S18 acetylase RimI-like enzyme